MNDADQGGTEQVAPCELSIVVPLLNEREVLDESYQRLKTELQSIGASYEIIFVDDGSTDGSRDKLQELSALDPAVRVIGLSRNFGHEIATTAGLHYAKGQAAIVIDADMQDPPEVMRQFVARWREGYQVVYGVRRKREGEGVLKKITSFLFYRLMERIADVPIPLDTGDFRLIDRRVLDIFRTFSEDPRFFRGLIAWIGFRQVGVPFVRQPRIGGHTKYRPIRLFRLAFDTITAFSTFTALLVMATACALALGSLAFAGVVLVLWLSGSLAMEGWMWAALGFLGLWNLQFWCLALLGEYVVRTHRHTQGRPLYIVDCVVEKGSAQSNCR